MPESEITSRSRSGPETPTGSNILFGVVMVFGAVFVVTVLIAIAIAFGDPQVPMNRWINRHLTMVLTVEVVLLVVTGLLAMTIDRVRTLSQIRIEERPETNSGDGEL